MAWLGCAFARGNERGSGSRSELVRAATMGSRSAPHRYTGETHEGMSEGLARVASWFGRLQWVVAPLLIAVGAWYHGWGAGVALRRRQPATMLEFLPRRRQPATMDPEPATVSSEPGEEHGTTSNQLSAFPNLPHAPPVFPPPLRNKHEASSTLCSAITAHSEISTIETARAAQHAPHLDSSNCVARSYPLECMTGTSAPTSARLVTRIGTYIGKAGGDAAARGAPGTPKFGHAEIDNWDCQTVLFQQRQILLERGYHPFEGLGEV